MRKVPGMKIGCEHDELRWAQHGGSCALVKIDMRKVGVDSGDGGWSQGRGNAGKPRDRSAETLHGATDLRDDSKGGLGRRRPIPYGVARAVRQAMPVAALGRGRCDLTKADRQFGQKGVFFGSKTKEIGW